MPRISLIILSILVLGMMSFSTSNFVSNSLDDSTQSIPMFIPVFAQVDDDVDDETEDEIDDEDIELRGTILVVNDDDSFDLETIDGIKIIHTDEKTIIDDGLELQDIVGFVVDIDAVDVNGSLFATEIEFNDKIKNEIEHEVDDDKSEDSDDRNESDALQEINKADREIKKADEKIAIATDKGKDIELAELKLDEARELLAQAELYFDDRNFDDAEELAEDAKDLASESRMKYLGKTLNDNDKQSKKDEKLAKEQEKFEKKQAKVEEKRVEKLAKLDEKLAKAQERLDEKLTKLETKLTEKAKLSEERANKILEKITKETQKYDKRVQKLLDKYQSGKYFGDFKNTDKITKSFIISFDGTALDVTDSTNIETLSGELYLENQLTGSHSKKFRVTGGEIFVGEIEVYEIIFGKARLTSSGSGGEKDSMIVIAQVSNGVDIRTLKLSIDLSEEFNLETESADIEILFPRSKIASMWFISATGNFGLIESEIPVDTTEIDSIPSSSDDTITIPDDTTPDDIPETIALTVSTTQDSYVTGNEIVILGNVDEIFENLPIVLQIVTATDLIEIAQIIPDSSGAFTYTIQANGPQWLTDNTITIKAFYGGNNIAQTSFEFSVE